MKSRNVRPRDREVRSQFISALAANLLQFAIFFILRQCNMIHHVPHPTLSNLKEDKPNVSVKSCLMFVNDDELA